MSVPCSSSPVASTSSSNSALSADSVSAEPKPGTSTSEEPKPGPSTSAAEFDLEVFDSGSSCSLEDAWGLGCSPEHCFKSKDTKSSSSRNRRRQRRSWRNLSKKKIIAADFVEVLSSAHILEFDNSSEDTGEEEMSPPPCTFDPVSVCPSETEEAVSDHDDELEELAEQDEVQDEEDEEDEDEEECSCGEGALPCSKCTPSTSKAVIESGTDSDLSVSEVKIKSCPENIDEIVQDHDNFGTDENEDSLDSLALAGDCVTLYRHDSEDSIEDDSSLLGPAKRKNQDESDRASELEQTILRKKKKISQSGSSFELQWTSRCVANEESVQKENSTSKIVRPIVVELQRSQDHQPATNDSSLEQEVCSPPSLLSMTCSTPTCSKNFSVGDDTEQLPPPSDAVVSWVATFSRWSHCEKIVAINELIRACHPTEVRHMMNVIAPQFQRDFISLLPKELALYVLSFLDPRDLLRAAQTCRYWRILAEDNLLWREKCREAGLSDVLETLNIRRKKCSIGGFSYSAWKAGFMRQHNIEMNWRVLPIRSPKVLKGHDDHVITCLQFSGNRIVSGSDDNTLKVWSATTGKCLKTLVGHTGGVWSSQMEGNIIVSGSTDRTLKVWNADSGACVHTLYGHTSTVRCMHLHGSKVVSGSRDATLRMWDISTGECLHVLMGHVAAVRCVQYDGRLVVSGAYDYMVKVWNPETEECLHTLSGHTNRVYSLQFDGIHVVSGSLDTSIRVWDVETGACKHALMGHQSLTSGMELRDNILVSGNADSTVKVWDITSGQCLQTLSGPNKHQSAVTCLQFNSKFVVTSSDDGTVKLWDVKTGEFIRDLVALESGGSGGVVWRIRANATKLVCAVGSRNGTEETKLLVLDFDVQDTK